MQARSQSSEPSLADVVRAILASRGLTIAKISRSSRALAPGKSRLHVPHNFCSSLRNARFSPSLYQLLALSAVSDYRLADWLAIFGLSLDNAPRFQAQLPARRTVRLDAHIYQPGSPVRWFQDLREADLTSSLVPLSQWLRSSAARSFESLPSSAAQDFLYVKIGLEDAFAFPDLLPGSIVRIDCSSGAIEHSAVQNPASRTLYLVEHSRGVLCSRLSRSGPKTIVLCPRQLPYAAVELREGSQTRILGIADLEIRPTRHLEIPVVPPALGTFWTPAPLTPSPSTRDVGQLLRESRLKSRFSFRQASERTAVIAKALGDARYYCSPGALSDYETRPFPPRHVHKIVSLCAAYFANVGDVLEHAGAELSRGGQHRIPDRFLDNLASDPDPNEPQSRFLEQMATRFKDLPYFLHAALPSVFGVSEISVRDVFWAGGVAGSIDSYSTGAQFLVVDRKQKTPRPSLYTPLWAQPAYILQRRDGSYTWGFCVLQGGTLIVRVCFAGSPNIERLRHRIDADVVGEVVGVVRTLR